jgi:ABC-type branched-subunit amino acid transport system substrate-binding protein
MLKNIRLLFALLFVLATSAAAETSKSRPIKIGAIYGFTGFASVWSTQARRGIELARDEINHVGGISGRNIEIFLRIAARAHRAQ